MIKKLTFPQVLVVVNRAVYHKYDEAWAIPSSFSVSVAVFGNITSFLFLWFLFKSTQISSLKFETFIHVIDLRNGSVYGDSAAPVSFTIYR